jgi:glutathione synthase/RimK-type ligase-like ATP-grasp enzyme
VLTIAIATCAELPDLDADEQILVAELIRRGLDARPVVWDDESVDWSSFEAVVIRATWDYSLHRDAFMAWADRVETQTLLLNPAAVVQWNTDKRYLLEMAAAGVPIVPTVFLAPGEAATGWEPPAGFNDFVIKPAVSAGSRDTMRYSLETSGDAPARHVQRLLAGGEVIMIQPYLDAVDTVGETALIFIGGEFSHAIRKGQMLSRDEHGDKVAGLYVQEDINARSATQAELDVAKQVLAAIPGDFGDLLYARVDVIPDGAGNPVLLELELTEPSLFFEHDADAAVRFATALLARI